MSPNRDQPSPWFAWRMAVFFGALFLIYGVHISYFPVWLSWRGLSPQEISIITALPIFIRVALTPAAGAYADAHGNHREVIIALSVAAAALVLAMAPLTSFWALLFAAVPYSIAISTMMPLTETIAVAGVRSAGHDYGRMRLWGSLTFLVATLACGLLTDLHGTAITVWLLLAATLATAGVSLVLPKPAAVPARTFASEVDTGSREENATKQRPRALLRFRRIGKRSRIDATAPPRSQSGLLRALLMQPVFLVFLLAVGAILCSHAAFYTFGALHLKGRGISGQQFGILWAVSIAAEIAVLAYSARVMAWRGPLELIMFAGVAGVVRWGAMSLDPPFEVLLILQALHGATYGAAHLGAIHFIARAVPGPGAGTAQALYSSISNGLFTALSTLVAGHVYPALAGRTFLVMAALCGLGVVGGIWLTKTWNGGAVFGGSEDATPTMPPEVGL